MRQGGFSFGGRWALPRTVSRLTQGCAAVFAELQYDDPAGYPQPLVLTTGVSIVPDTMPYPETSVPAPRVVIPPTRR